MKRGRQRFMGDQQIARPDFRTFQPSSPWFPSLLDDGLEQGVVLLSASRKQNAVFLQQIPIFHQPPLDVSGGGFVHPDVEKHGSLRWRRGRHGRQDRIGTVSDGSPWVGGAALTSAHDSKRSPEERSKPFEPCS